MQHEQDQAHDEDDVNETGGYVKCEKSEQPENDQNCGDDPKHVHLRVAEREPIRDRALSSSRVVRAGREFCPVVDTLIEFVAGRLAGNGGLGVPYGTSIERGLDAES